MDGDRLWYKDAVIYQLHVRAYRDSNADGIGDFRGLIQKLDYLQDFGVTAVWLLPFYPSPLRDDGYDIADYGAVNPAYGTLRDVKQFVGEAHRRGLRVINELVCNHTSDQHPWFQRARQARPGSNQRDFYVWSDTTERYREARIIFTDTETSNWSWDPVANAYYWHRFFHHQPDLNFDNPSVHRALLKQLDFWFDMGWDGVRLDAIPYLYEREGTNCENLPETHAFLKKLRRHVDERYSGRMLLAEANQWPEDSVAYFGDGDECHMAFHFPVMPRMYMALRMEDRRPLVDILENTPAIPETAQWAMFLRNHDELTLEMVTDEERDYMYRVYAQDPQLRINVGIRRRLAPLLDNSRRRIELLNALLFSLPGTPVLYYGDEIGMGDNPYLGDRNAVRTPMQWSPDRSAGFSEANPHSLYLPVIVDPEYHYQTVNVEAQQRNPSSLLWWMKRLIGLRRGHRVFGRGTLEFLQPENRKVLAFLRRDAEETMLVVANLSRFVQYVELDLAAFRGATPVELFGQTRFPPIGELPYLLTLGPHTFYWFVLEPVQPRAELPATLPLLQTDGSWERLADGSADAARAGLARALPTYLRARRWFGGKSRPIRSARVRGSLPLALRGGSAHLALVQVAYAEGDDETYVLPLAFAQGEGAERLVAEQPHAVVALVRCREGEGVLHDALAEPELPRALLAAIAGRRTAKGAAGELVAATTGALRALRRAGGFDLEPQLARGEQSNSSIVYGERYILKLFRKLEAGPNPDAEIGRLLTERGFPNTAPVVGTLELRQSRSSTALLGILHGFVPDAEDAWSHTLDVLGRYFEQAVALEQPPSEPPASAAALLERAAAEPTEEARAAIGVYLEEAALLGQRTGELHVALAAGSDPAFAPEPFGTLYQRSLYQSLRSSATETFDLLRRGLGGLPEAAQDEARRVLETERATVGRYGGLLRGRIDAQRTRVHGDYHLGQVLYNGHDFVILDFEGEPARPLGERRIKRSPLRDVAGMIRSFHYASRALFTGQGPTASVRPEDVERLEPWARYWYGSVSAAFLRGYLAAAAAGRFLPSSREELTLLLDVFLLEKALYELGYELNNRPDWALLPLRGIRQLLEDAS
ncbi:MAG TPA: maltose alpha-D-glucosyltransferase [Chloroflexota bacterium]